MTTPLNPSITSPRDGNRYGRQQRNPRDITGKRYREQQAEKAARDAAKDTDIEAVKRDMFQRGHDAGHAAGMDAGWGLLADLLIDAGVLTEDKLHELVDAAVAEDAE